MAEAERAYPEWVPMANALRKMMFVLQTLAVVITFAVAGLAAYVYFGNAMVASIGQIVGQLQSLEDEMARDDAATVRMVDGTFTRYCSSIELVQDPNNTAQRIERFHTIKQANICDRKSDLLRKLDLTYATFPRWGPHDDRALGVWIELLKGYVLPVLTGLLGSMAYVLRRYLRSIGDRLLNPRDLREYIVRLVLGSLCGVVIGFFTSDGGVAADGHTPETLSHLLGAPALAFLAGYGVEVVFRMLDGLAETVFPARSR